MSDKAYEKEVKRISLKAFTHLYGESEKCNRRFCFILGSGASRSAGIPTGVEMARLWAEELKEKYEEEELLKLQAELGIESIEPTSNNYFGIYELRYYPDYREGHAYFERELEKGAPSLGHHALAKILAGERHNLTITTNFDSLIEDALFIYTDKKPLVVGHESLTEFVNLNISRPVIAKIHRSLYFQPFNRQDETVGLAEGWQETIKNAFMVYTPVVIGYAGGDHSLMKLLKDDGTKMNGLYWCYRSKEEPSDEIIDLVKHKNGCLIPIDGFDQMMFMLSRKLEFENPEKAMREVTEARVERYNDQYKEFSEKNTADGNTSEVAKEVSAYNMQLLEDYNNAIRLNPNSAETYSKRGNIYSRLKKYDEAMEDHNKAIELNPKNAGAYNNRGVVYNALKEYEKAMEDYNKAIELYSNSADIYNNRGNIYSGLKKYDEAIEDYNKAIGLNPKFSMAYSNRGNVYSILKENEKAITDYNKAIELNPDYAEAYNNRGNIYSRLKKYDEAMEDYNKAIELNPVYASAYNNRGIIYSRLKKYDEAMEDFNKAIEFDPKHSGAYNARGNIYRISKDYEKAIADFEKSIELDSNNKYPHKNMAIVFSEKAEYKKALDWVNKATMIDPEYKIAYQLRAKIYNALGEDEKAADDEAKAEALPDD